MSRRSAPRRSDSTPSNARRTVVVVVVVLVALVIAAIVIRPYVTGPDVLPIEEMPEAALPDDPAQARIAIQERAVKDQLAGMDEETRKKRHARRLEQLKEIENRAAGGQ